MGIFLRKSNFVILGLSMMVYFGQFLSASFNSPPVSSNFRTNDIGKFAGSSACKSCHKDIYESHIKTAHYLDSRLATKSAIKGSFTAGKNKFVYNKWMEVELRQKKDSFFQVAYMNGIEYQAAPFHVVIGSGRKGQTFLYWNEDKLYQLPVSYYTPLNNWCNSPGFSINYIKFDRVIPAQCLECHGTYARVLEDKDNISTYDKTQMIYGIDCEKCHGPAAEHVAFQKEHPDEKTAKFITNLKQLDRQQKLDGCALCHSGFRTAKKPPFTYMPGDKLDDHSVAGYSPDSVSTLDVHGNQYGLLMAGKCFKMSAQMNCSTCHNPHVNEVNSPEIFSQRCITCHADTKHSSLSLPAEKKLKLNENCIDCHMPMLPSRKIVLNVANSQNNVPDMVRTHKISIYPEITKELLEKIKSKKK